MHATEELLQESLRLEERHNSRYRYSKLGGKTPLAALEVSSAQLRFSLATEAPRYPLPKPERGRYHLVRFVRSDLPAALASYAGASPSTLRSAEQLLCYRSLGSCHLGYRNPALSDQEIVSSACRKPKKELRNGNPKSPGSRYLTVQRRPSAAPVAESKYEA